ncbi:MAG TPA: hypothetical protein VIQ51_14960 [Chryseosolibacter sp.]
MSADQVWSGEMFFGMDLNIFKNLFEKDDEPLTSAALKKALSDILTPVLRRWGLTKYDGEYLWYSDFNKEGIRRVFKYTLMKGNRGLCAWGVAFKNIPVVTQEKKLQYHRTEKNIALQLWEWPHGYTVSLESDVPPTDMVSHSSEKEFRHTLQEIVSRYRVEIENWYHKADTLKGCLEIVNKQIEDCGVYRTRWPSGNYMKIFLLALQGDKAQANELLTKATEPTFKRNVSWQNVISQVRKEIDSF